MIYFTSDLHIGHKKIITMGNGRPFKSIEQHDSELIDRWNKKVLSKDDIVYVLGDVFWGKNSDYIKDYLSKLNGRKVLILGNHDRLIPNIKSNGWLEIVSYKDMVIGSNRIVLSHYPIAEWNGYYYNSYHLYGHTHGMFNLAKETLVRNISNGNCWDVGVDNNNYEPVSFDEIKEKIENNIRMIKNG
jgi:calcineurin-like phosphoesterase family protein